MGEVVKYNLMWRGHVIKCMDMGKQNYSLESAIEILKAQYEVAKDYEFVNQPVAYSLYQVWRLFNEFEPRRDLNDNA